MRDHEELKGPSSDSLGEKNPPVPYDPEHTHLRAVVLQDGGRQQGSYTFEVPEHDVQTHALQLLYFHDPVLDAGSVKHWLLTWPPNTDSEDYDHHRRPSTD